MASTAIVAGTARMTPMDTKSGVVTAMPNVIEALNARVNREPKEIIVHTLAVVMVWVLLEEWGAMIGFRRAPQCRMPP